MFLPAWRLPFGASVTALAGLVLAGCAPAEVSSDPALADLVQRFGTSEIQRLPEEADALGIPPAAFGGPYNGLLNDRSMAAAERARTERLEYMTELERINRATLSPSAVRTYDALRSTLEATIRVDAHGHGVTTPGRSSVYVISFMDGAFTDLVKFLTLHAPIRTRADADAWLKRLEQMDEAMRDERRRFEVDLDDGAIPPRSVLVRTLDKARQLRPAVPREHVLVQHFTEALAQIADIPEDDIAKLATRAAELVGGDIRKEYDALIRLLETTLPKAQDELGVWRFDDGETYYNDLLKLHTTSVYTPLQLNELGKKLVEQISGQLDPLLANAGLIEGSVGGRLRALSLQPQYLFPETPEGRLALIDSINAKLNWANGITDRVVTIERPTEIAVRETPRIAQDTASKAYYRAAPLDGSQPAIYSITLRATSDFPAWALPTLTFHEGVPGHHLQVEISRRMSNQPVINHLISYPAFSEGWATYAEDLALELGAYDGDPMGKIGYLQSQLLRAARLVADTGIHSQRWKREEAIRYLEDTVGVTRATAEIEVDRYAVRPGVPSAYMIGREAFRRMRGQAQSSLKSAFDMKAFHAAVLGPGPRPLSVVQADVDAFITAQTSPPAAE